ncbi:sensor histidine kinase [Nocardioides dilutus]
MYVPAFVVRLERRWVANGLPDYPLWIAALIDSAALATGVVAVSQRAAHGDNVWLAIALVAVALLPWPVELFVQGRSWPLFATLTTSATAALMLWQPLDYDFAPLFLVLMVGHVTACVGAARGLAVLAAGETVVVAAYATGALPGAALGIWATAIVLALDIGFVMRSQQLRIQAQAEEHAVRERQAVLEERQRIAREVHDLVAHSLSVTMLHLTAARRDLEDGGDVAETVDALREAERVGRQAVSDVRRTVGLLGSDAGGATAPAPTVADVEALVADFRAAGLDVALTITGDLDQVPPATGLGLYRIVQESLTNVARHSPGATATVVLDLASDPGRLVVRNPVPAGLRPGAGGSGVTGMTQRAELLGASLTAGPGGGEWVVVVDLPRGDTRDAAGHVCPLPRLVRGLHRPSLGTT